MKKLALMILLFANIPTTNAFLFFFFKDKKTDFEKAIQDIEKRDPAKLEQDTYNLEDPHKHDFKALTYVIENKQRELEKEKNRNEGTIQAALLWLALLGVEVVAGISTGEPIAQGICVVAGIVSGAQVLENSYEAFNRDNNLKEKDRAYRDMKIIVHDAEISRLEKKKTLAEEKYENKEKKK